MKILYIQPETAGDVLIATAVIDGLKKKFPEAGIVFATKKQYWPILEGNPHLKGVIEYHPSMDNQYSYQTMGAHKRPFDLVLHPYFMTQKMPSCWLQGEHSPSLREFYANVCSVEPGNTFLGEDNNILKSLPDDYITVQGQTSKNIKDYSFIDEVIKYIKGIKVVQVGGEEDGELKNADLDLRGKTTPQELASVLRQSRFHLSLDSFPMHVCAHVGTEQLVLFGGTFPQAALSPTYNNTHVLQTDDYGLCHKACHYVDCAMEKVGLNRCIDNIPVQKVLSKITEIIGEEYVRPLEPIKLSAYMIIKNGIMYNFPFVNALERALAVCEEVIVVDGGSFDDTVKVLNNLAHQHDNLKVFHRKWDHSKHGFIGEEKAYAASLCTGTHRIQLDADEYLVENFPGEIKQLVDTYRFNDCLSLPIFNLYKDDEHIRLDPNPWKFRVYRTDKGITHGVNAGAIMKDPNGQEVIDKNKTDCCDPIYKDSGQVVKTKHPFDHKLFVKHQELGTKQIENEEYIDFIKDLKGPYVLHLSWSDLEMKKKRGEFWDGTIQGMQLGWHNTTQDIDKRISENTEYVIEVGDIFKDELRAKSSAFNVL